MDRLRKDNIKKGERTQSPFGFRLDNDNRERLSAVPNKGRLRTARYGFINLNLITNI